MPDIPSTAVTPRPTVDEWGVYDPQQAGLAALYTRLAEAPVAPTRPGDHATRARLPAQPAPRAGTRLD